MRPWLSHFRTLRLARRHEDGKQLKTGWNFHELYLWHDTGNAATWFPPGLSIEPGEHAENAATKRRFKNLMDVSGLPDKLARIDAGATSPKRSSCRQASMPRRSTRSGG